MRTYKEVVKTFSAFMSDNWSYIRQSLVLEENGKEVVEEVEAITGYEEGYETYERVGEMILIGYMLGKRDVLNDIKNIRKREGINEKDR